MMYCVPTTETSLLRFRVLNDPSRKRRPKSIARLIAAGEQPSGIILHALIQPGNGRDYFAKALATVQHPMELPPPIPQRLGAAVELISQW